MKEGDIDCFEDTAEECVKRCFSALHCPQPDFCHKPQHTWHFKAWGHFQSKPERLVVILSKDLLCPTSNQIIEVRLLFFFFSFPFFFFLQEPLQRCAILVTYTSVNKTVG